DLSGYDEKREDKIKAIVQKDREEEYDLSKSGLFRVYVCQHSESHYTCIFSNHHAILDGWSMPVLFNDIHTSYLTLLKGELVASMVDISYGESQKYLQRHKGESDSFWKEYMLLLEDREDLSSLLKVSEKHTNLSSYRHIQDHQSLTWSIDTERYLSLKNLISKEGLTVNALLQYLWHKQLSIYSNQRTTVVGTTVSGRSLPVEGIESSVGLYINTLPLIVEHKEGKVMDLIVNLQSWVSDLNTYNDKSLSSLQDNGERLFSSLFVYENYPISDGDVSKDLDIRFRDSIEKIDYPLSLIAYERGEKVSLTLNYEGLLFEQAMMSQVLEGMELMLDQLLQDPNLTTDKLSYVSVLQYQDLIQNWNATGVEYDTSATIHELFERQVEKTPDHIALVYEDVKLSYRDLNERSNQLAHYLLENYQIKPDELIPLCLERSEQMLIGILGVLKSGGAYVPMDPNYPMDRIEHILGDTNARVVIGEERTKDRLYEYKELIDREEESLPLSILSLNSSDMKDSLGICSTENPLSSVSSSDLAYVIYTSGTTGKPKGVMIEHRSVVNFVESMIKSHRLDEYRNVGCYSNYVFDVFISETFPVLCNGNTLWLYSSVLRSDVRDLNKYIKENEIEVSFIPPVLLKELLPDTDLKLILVGGESFPTLDTSYEDIIFINEYGPTETTVWSTYHHYNEDHNPLNIGRPIRNTSVYVLDSHLRAVPLGGVGELYIGGVGVSRGYLNLAELTDERFVVNPFQREDEKEIGYNSRIYKTGDLVRFLPDGNLQYIGRNDFQVKIRGYRIELGEIENALLSYAGIRQGVVLAKEQGSGIKYLVGYYVSDAAVNHEDLSLHLSGHLPDYMVPSVYVHLEELPLTLNGKLDRRSLPEPMFTGVTEYIAPRTVLEKQLSELYGEVLGLESSSISIHDDFFRLGGNSIMAIKLISRIHRDLGFAVTVAMLFTHKNIYSLSHVLESSDNVMSNSMIGAITVSDVEDQKLSFAQERLWFLDQYEGGSSAYNIPMVFGLSGTTDLGVLKSSFSHLLSRHDILRTLILKDSEGQGYQYVSDKMLCISETVVSSVSELDLELEKEMGRVFLLSEELPISVRLFSLGDNFYLTVVIHHIAFDGWSIDIFFRELSIIYESLLLGIEPDLRPLSISYKDFALWQRDYLSGSVLSVQLDYWKTHLNGFEPLNLPLDYVRPSVVSYVGKSLSCSLSPDLSTHLRSLSKDLGISLYSVMLGGYYLLLSSYSGQRDIILGTPVANRHHSGLEDLIGFFVNTLVLRAELDFNLDISDYLVHISSLVSSAQIHQDVPFEKLVDELGLDHDASRHPVFQVMFGLESFGSESKTYYGLDSFLLPYEGSLHYDVAKFDLTTMIDDSGDSLLCSFTYSTALFRESTVKEMMSTYVYLLEQLVSFRSSSLSGIKISDLAFVGEASGLSFLKDVNGCYVDYVSDTTLQELFERQVERTPDDIALVYEDVKLTYRELNERSNQLAHYLLENYEIKPDELIPLCLERSEQMLIGILGVLKSGGAYVPMDPGYPMDRIEHILGDTNARVVIGEESTKNRLYDYKELIDREESSSLNIISLNALNIVDSLSTCSTDNPLPSVSSSDLAYVIYTSGTTGKPKGVMIEHRSVVNLVESIRGVYDYSERGKFTAYTSYVFDVSVSEIFSALLYGNELHLLSDTIRKDSSSISDYLLAQEITHTYLPPVLLSLLPRNVYPYLQAILYAGEPCDEETGIYWGEHKKLYNLYGPTESTIYATCKEIVEGEVHVIGKPIVNTTTYVLDEYLRHVPLGGVGELYIGGVGVSRGYLNLAELTDERFVVNPFQSEDEKEIGYNSRIYKTGDLVRFLPDGNLQYIGRNDFQVKIRGYRIELGEIENVLLSYAGIRQGVVLAKEQGSGIKYLVGYYVSDAAVNHEDLSMHLSGHLPDYMVPSVYVHLEELPLTLNGKLDRRSLPEPTFTGVTEYIAPRTVLEKQLSELYGEVLGLEPSSISIHDDFFRLGGNSIMAIKLISRIHRDLGFAVTVAMLFTHKNIYSLSHVLESSDNVMSNSMIGAITVSDVEDQKLSFAQERLWFLDQYEGGSSAYNIPMVFGLSGTTDLGVLKSSFSHLLSRHDILRTLILKDSEGQGYQYVSDKMLCINETVVSSVSELDLELEKEMGRVFLLSEELPISVRLFSLEDNFYLTVVIHHIAFDGWSIDIFFRELSIIYESLLLGIEPDLRPLSISYKDFALWQRDYLSGSVLSVQLDYWKTHLNGFEPLNLPLDYARPSVVSYVGKSLSCSFSPELSTHLRSLSKDLGISLYSVMLGGYYLLLSSYSGQRDIILGTPVANRHHSGLEDLIGFFVNTLVLRAELDFNLDISDYLVHISSLVSSAQIHQDVPFEKLVDELGLDHDASRHPVFQVMFGLESFGSESKTYYGLDSFLLPYEGSLHYDVAKFDLTTMIDDSGDSLLCSFTYSTALFRESTVKEMMSTYVYLLEQLVSFRSSSLSGIKISDLAFVGEASGLSFLKDVNGCYVDYVSDTTLQELFERQVERTPDDIALVYEDVKLTIESLMIDPINWLIIY
ncbi:amino acid adenylation domain-containing protein, partial [Chryseobacterium nematophagum]